MVLKSKSGSAGRFGSRYGSRLRKKVTLIENVQKKKSICPSCAFEGVRRVAKGIWQCRKCNYKFAGCAYVPFKKREELGH
jgi:large subunit ribosomal protein L37Ae